MHVIICGGGRMALSLATELAAEKHDVVIIERDPKAAKKLAETLNATVIEGNATDIEILDEAGLERADTVAALTPNESENLLICLNAKKRKSCRTAARIERDESEGIFKSLGIDTVIYPEKAAAHYLEELLTKPEVVDLAFIDRGDAVILEFVVGSGAKVIGKTIKEVEDPKGSIIIAVYDGGNLVIPSPHFKIKKGEKVLVLARNNVINRVRRLFGGD
jgi:trk system potassium uptake protein TrkA